MKFYVIFVFTIVCFRLCEFVRSRCVWPSSDVLFVIDSTINIDSNANHQKLVDFVRMEIGHMKLGRDNVQLAVAQFSPSPRYEFGLSFDDSDTMENRLNVKILIFL